jgi:hypothetical protein
MRLRLLVAVVAAAAPLAVRAQPPADHPFKAAKVGDYATFSVATKAGQNDIKGTMTNTVKAVTEKEVTVELTGVMNGMAIVPVTQKIDLTKAFDPAATVPAGAKGDAKIEKTNEGAEKLTLAGKTYETKWVTMKVTTKGQLGEVVMDMKTWVGKDIPLALGRMEMTSTVNNMPVTMRMELTDSGSKK